MDLAATVSLFTSPMSMILARLRRRKAGPPMATQTQDLPAGLVPLALDTAKEHHARRRQLQRELAESRGERCHLLRLPEDHYERGRVPQIESHIEQMRDRLAKLDHEWETAERSTPADIDRLTHLISGLKVHVGEQRQRREEAVGRLQDPGAEAETVRAQLADAEKRIAAAEELIEQHRQAMALAVAAAILRTTDAERAQRIVDLRAQIDGLTAQQAPVQALLARPEVTADAEALRGLETRLKDIETRRLATVAELQMHEATERRKLAEAYDEAAQRAIATIEQPLTRAKGLVDALEQALSDLESSQRAASEASWRAQAAHSRGGDPRWLTVDGRAMLNARTALESLRKSVRGVRSSEVLEAEFLLRVVTANAEEARKGGL